MKIYKMTQQDYIILGLIDDDGCESKKTELDMHHYDLSWDKGLSTSDHWVYFPRKNSIFSWDELDVDKRWNIMWHLEDKYGIKNAEFDNLSRFGPIDDILDERSKRLDAEEREFGVEASIKTSQWYKKEDTSISNPYKITRVNQDRNEDIESLKGVYFIDQTPYGALKKFLKRYPFLYDYEDAGITLMAVVDEERVPEVQEKYRRKREEKQRIKDEETREKTKDLWYMKD